MGPSPDSVYAEAQDGTSAGGGEWGAVPPPGALTPSCRKLCCRTGLCRWPARSPAQPQCSSPVCCRPRLWGHKAGRGLLAAKEEPFGEAPRPPRPSGGGGGGGAQGCPGLPSVEHLCWGLRQPPGETEAGGRAAWLDDAVTGPGSEPRVHGPSTPAPPTVGSRRPL